MFSADALPSLEEKPSSAPKSETPLLSLRDVGQSYHRDSSTDVQILDGVSLDVKPGEIVGLLGRSGSGKSMLLRIMAGLLIPSSGTVLWRGTPLKRPIAGLAMVFQSPSLFPWLNLQDNVELALEADGMKGKDRELRAEEAIDLIGLGGYENAWPHELSGGLSQRAGLARALAVHPDLLLMDEPFSSLDVLTAENLRTDLVELWCEKKLPVQSILMVTHSIEEAVLMCDRILVFAANPGRIEHEVIVPLAHPRLRDDPSFLEIVDHIYTLMTRRTPVISEADLPDMTVVQTVQPQHLPIAAVSVGSMVGLIEALAAPPVNGRADLPLLAAKAHLELDDLFPLVEALQILELAEVEDGDLLLTHEAQRFAESDFDERKTILRHALLNAVPLVKTICAVLDERPSHTVGADRFRDELGESMSAAYAQQTLQTIISWARYAELFDYNEESDQLFLNKDSVT
ncbi:nitrate/sulfonate/bicarbonate ABC transporter ATP-binding protein [Acetobacter sicerae]|uniref:Nitrate/sulfonate/bicarbonate ABC transporter ATP-binding protein n=1 Tax=Acetobacter sicerae TaxID=85325 RepID=A0ABS8VYB8_9PROT|nr:nitrate/sulfonate/bicarbonate ABC transporter ATP-binding protein [Acetobacter sicerae]MCE0744388.1 nitrate/sulfonate/bicarbonate ABC transporter ATP-binding protein [Acetobacter sicerae]